jgi:hypothetical protein
MKIEFSVSGLPPKKDGANSMWRKGSELERIKALRIAAHRAMGNYPLAQKWVHLDIKIYSHPGDGDLDNFITGICDSLMAAHPHTPWNIPDWINIDPQVQPIHPVVYKDDVLVKKISSERLAPVEGSPRYELVLDFE